MIYDIDIDIYIDTDIDIHINRHLGLQKWGGDTINGYKQTWHWMCYIYKYCKYMYIISTYQLPKSGSCLRGLEAYNASLPSLKP